MIDKYLEDGIFREVLTAGAECMEENKAQKWLSDDRGNTVIRKEDNEWGDAVWSPRVIAAGFKYWAVVVPEKALGQMQMKRFVEEYRTRGVTVQTFADPDEAMAWLESVG